jgi:hypothetical protein
MDTRDLATARELHSDVGGGDVVREFGNNENVEGIDGEKGGVNGSPERLDGSTNGCKAIVGLQDTWPGGGGEADLMAEVGHEQSLSKGRNCDSEGMGS